MGMPAATVPTAVSLASQLRFAVARLARQVRQAGIATGDDLTASRLAALATIEKQGPLTLGELAAIERVQPPTMTRLVSRLEELGLATREVDANDRRVSRVRETEAGRALLAKSRTRRDAFLTERIGELTAEERGLLARAIPLLERLTGDRV
jgi:DNA-binding MarR family transcriptional regulator